MMIEPPIDKLVDKIGCKYALVTLITKRTRFLLEKKADYLADSGQRAVTVAAREVYNGTVEARTE